MDSSTAGGINEKKVIRAFNARTKAILLQERWRGALNEADQRRDSLTLEEKESFYIMLGQWDSSRPK